MRTFFAALVLVLLGTHDAAASQWIIGSATGSPGSTVSIPVWVTGDGATSDTQVELVFDDARLTLPVAGGSIPGAPQASGSYCVRQYSNRIGLLYLTGGGSPIPAGSTLVCQIPFTIAFNASAGTTLIQGVNHVCAASTGNPSCSASTGQITIQGTSSSVMEDEPPAEYEVVALLSSEQTTSVEALTGLAPSDPALPEAVRTSQPRRVKPMMLPRARGEFKAYLQQHPNSARAKLERYVVFEFDTFAEAQRAVGLLRSDRIFDYVALSIASRAGGPKALGNLQKDAVSQYHFGTLDTSRAWQLAGGWGLVGVPENGVDPTHPALRSFDSNNLYVGGNVLPAFGFNRGFPDDGNADEDGNGWDDEFAFSFNYDELDVVSAVVNGSPNGCALPASDPVCVNAGIGTACMRPSNAGHGTHVAGLIAANTTAGTTTAQGVCRYCGLGIAKISRAICQKGSDGTYSTFSSQADFAGAVGSANLIGVGVQVLNLSFGSSPANLNPCASPTAADEPNCLMLQIAAETDVAVVAASGNARSEVDFPARDPRVIAVGGVDAMSSFWDDSPGNILNCSAGPSQCGSNYTQNPNSSSKQELVAPAKSVRSTVYRGMDWNPKITCGDSFGGGSASDGIGTCTGTSMSAPQVSGIIGMLRSINPLVRVGNPESNLVYGIRNVLRDTTDRANQSLPWNPQYGYGIPNAYRAASRMLGTVRGQQVLNRVTPLFTLYSSAATDFAHVATPQAAMALVRNQAVSYTAAPNPAAPATPGYAQYPSEAGQLPPTPVANAFVLTTEFDPVTGNPTLLPLYWLDKCVVDNNADRFCDTNDQDHLLVTATHLQAAVANGYQFRGRQGYVYPLCSPEPACVPAGAEKLHRMCNVNLNDCAVFLQSQFAAFQALGYTASFPAQTSSAIGYAYPAVDTDQDGLVNGMEIIVGTSAQDADSDDDFVADGVEFPQAGVASGDPCQGPNVTCTRPVMAVFSNSFE